MKLSQAAAMIWLVSVVQADTVKMCLDFLPSGHVRTDPIISQTCVSDHVHTFYGPQQFRPETTPQNLLDTPVAFSSSQIEENKSLYWHPSIYQYSAITGSYTRALISLSTGYYRWDDSVSVMAFPPGFRMIAGTDPDRQGVERFSECIGEKPCTRTDSCKSESGFFPSSACDEMGIAMQFPTCWNGELGDSNDHMSHVAYTLDGMLSGPCPSTHQAGRFPQIQLFVRIANYPGGWYTFSDDSDIFHADFMNGWINGKLQTVIGGCQAAPGAGNNFNPPCGCDELLTLKPITMVDTAGTEPEENENELLTSSQPCPIDTKQYIVNEEVDVVTTLPRGTCVGTIEPKMAIPFVTDCVKESIPVAPPEQQSEDEDDGDEDEGGDEEGDEEEEEGDEEDESDEEENSGEGSDEEDDEEDESDEEENSGEGSDEEDDEEDESDKEENSGEGSSEEDDEEDESGEGNDEEEDVFDENGFWD